jgi:Ca2+-binding RTX toxin-like protein
MANVFYDYGIVDTEVDINHLVRNATAQYFYDNVNVDLYGRIYEDLAVAQYSVNGVYFSGVFGGSGLAVNAQNRITDGVVTGYLETIWNGSEWIPMWGVEDIAYSAVALANTAYTTSTADEQAVIREILSGNDTFWLSGFNDQAHGYAGDDTIEAGYGFDTVYGGLGNDYIQGGFNGDRLYGEEGNDDLRGGNGLDLIVGGVGNDTIRGAKGTDTLTGGEGADVFIFHTDLDGTINVDTITDFVSGVDRIELSATIFGNAGAVGANVGLSQYITYNAATGVLSYDQDGTGAGAAKAFAILGTDSHPTSVDNIFWITA